MSLKEMLNLKEEDVVVVVGSRGKTTFCLNLCQELQEKEKIVFFTTTTKIYPVDEKLEFINLTNKIFKENSNIEIEKFLQNYNFENKTYVLGIFDKKIGKIKSLPINVLEKIVEKANFTVIEGDGSKEKKLKGWSETEPVFIRNTTKTVGIIPINCIGMDINDENIHRIEKFLEISKSKKNEKITVEILKEIILHKNGLFQYAIGKKYLILNCVESEKDFENAKKLKKLIEKETLIIKVIFSSLKNKKYFDCN